MTFYFTTALTAVISLYIFAGILWKIPAVYQHLFQVHVLTPGQGSERSAELQSSDGSTEAHEGCL